MSTPLVLLLCAMSAVFYVAAPALMKLGGGAPVLLLVLPVVAALGVAAWFEGQALHAARFGIVVLAIQALELLITAGVAISIGERYSLREIAGVALVVAGMIVASQGEGHPQAPTAAPAAALG
jgi:drug/metabolite transporter (DMT)-like permease